MFQCQGAARTSQSGHPTNWPQNSTIIEIGSLPVRMKCKRSYWKAPCMHSMGGDSGFNLFRTTRSGGWKWQCFHCSPAIHNRFLLLETLHWKLIIRHQAHDVLGTASPAFEHRRICESMGITLKVCLSKATTGFHCPWLPFGHSLALLNMSWGHVPPEQAEGATEPRPLGQNDSVSHLEGFEHDSPFTPPVTTITTITRGCEGVERCNS